MKPTALSPLYTSVPVEIRSLQQWVCWRYTPVDSRGRKRWAKLPISPVNGKPARPNDRNTWCHFAQAVEVCKRGGLDGVGFMFTASDPFVGVDLDNCRDPHTGQVEEWARECIHRLNTYTEVSPSGTGLKCIAKGSLPPGRRRSGNIEIYETGRYFAITGRVVNGFNNITLCPNEVTELHRSLLGSPSASSAPPATTASPKSPHPLLVPDDEILRRAHHAKNGKKFQRLWDGRLTDAQDDHSVADLMLCRILAFWCGPRPELIDRLFRCSKLHRPKWDEVHFADGCTYGQATIAKAILGQGKASFQWLSPQPSSPTDDRGIGCHPQPSLTQETEKARATDMTLHEFLNDAYDSPTDPCRRRAVITDAVRIDDQDERDVYPGFCKLWVTVPDASADRFRLTLHQVPYSEEVVELGEDLEGKWKKIPTGQILTLFLDIKSSPALRRLAKAIRRVTGRGQRYDDPNWKWITRRTADSLERFAQQLRLFRQGTRGSCRQ